MADQLLLPMVLSGGGRFKTTGMTRHTRTNVDVIERFGTAKFEMTFDGPQAQIDVYSLGSSEG